jgi:hypothetical protein
MSNAQPAVTFDEIRALMRNLPGPDLEAGKCAVPASASSPATTASPRAAFRPIRLK